MVAKTFLALSLLPSAFAHFKLNWPAARGSEEGTADQFPCGGYNNVQQQRTDWPISGGPLQLNMGHPQTNLAVYMAVGSTPGSGFSVKLRPQFVIEVLGDFCIGQLNVPTGLNVSDGTPASIQVVSNAHASGGLYQVSIVILKWRHELIEFSVPTSPSAVPPCRSQITIATARTTPVLA